MKKLLLYYFIFFLSHSGILSSNEIEQSFHSLFLSNKDQLYSESIELYENPNSSDFERAVSSYYLGYVYYHGSDEIPKSLEQAYKYLKISADIYEYPNAMELMGIMYLNEIYVERDYDEAIYYFEKAIENKNYSSYGLISDAYYYLGDWDQAEIYARKCIKNYDSSKIFPTKKNNIDCTYDLAWYLINHNVSEERETESLKLFKSIESLDVRAAIFLTYYFIDPLDAFQFELDMLKHFENFESHHDKAMLSSELAYHYNHIVKPKKTILYANDALNYLNLFDQENNGSSIEDRIYLKKSLIIALIADGNFDEASRVLNDTYLELNRSNVYSSELYEKHFKADFYELKFYEAEIAFHKAEFLNAFALFEELIRVFSHDRELDIETYLFQAHAYLASIHSSYFSNEKEADYHFQISNEIYKEDYSWAYQSSIDYPIFPYEVIDYKLKHLKKYNQDSMKDFIEHYLQRVETLKDKNYGLQADAYSRATIYFYAAYDNQLCIDNGNKAIDFILQSERGEFHVQFHKLYEVIGDCYFRLQQPDQALEKYSQALQIYERYLANLRYPSLNFKKDYKNLLHKVIDIKINEHNFSKNEVFQLIQKAKISFSSEAIFRNYAKQLDNNAYFSLIVSKSDLNEKLEILKSDYKKLNSRENFSKKLSNIFLDKILNLEGQIKDIENQINTKFQKQNQYYFERNIELEKIQKNLNQNEIIFDFSINNNLNFLTIVSQKNFEIFKIDKAESELTREIKIFLGDIFALKDISKSSSIISNSLFSEFDLNKFKEKDIYLIYDQQLSSLPFSALLFEDEYLIKNFTLTHIPSFPSFFYLKNKSASNYENSLIGFANPKLNENKNSILDNKLISKILRSSGDEIISNIQKLPELPNTESELLKISKLITGKKKLFTRDEANEVIVKTINLNSQYLIFATHALIAGEIDNIYESGLVLTPSNNVSQLNEENDGFLSEHEIINLDINNSLTLLSACNTARSGDRNDSDSLSGLTKSFFYAGSNNILSTLWSIETNSAETFTEIFFQKIIDKSTYSDSARQAKISLINSKNYNHPFYWAPYILAGLN